MNGADLSNWVLDGVNGWAGVSVLLKDIRVEKSPLTEATVLDCADRVHENNVDFTTILIWISEPGSNNSLCVSSDVSTRK